MKKLSRKLLSVLLVIAMLVPTGALMVNTSAAENTTMSTETSNIEFLTDIEYHAESSLKKIYTADDLIKMQTNYSGSFCLMNDIDLSGVNWTPIGSSEDNQFSGNFYGNGYTIKNLTITGHYSTDVSLGLFGYVGERNVIRDIRLENVSIDASSSATVFAGAFFGHGYGHWAQYYLRNCIAEGSITVSSSNKAEVGGLAGHMRELRVYNCISNVEINTKSSSVSYVGGLIAYVDQGGIYNSCNYGNITSYTSYGINRTGGMVGCFDGGSGTSTGASNINYCFNLGNVDAISNSWYVYAGGIVGNFPAGDLWHPSISYGFNAGNVSGQVKNPSSSMTNKNGAFVSSAVGYYMGSVSNFYNVGEIYSKSGALENKAAGDVFGYVLLDYKTRDARMTDVYLLKNEIPNVGIIDDRDTIYMGEIVETNVVDLNLNEMYLPQNYPAFDFDTIWGTTPGYPFPTLQGTPLCSDFYTVENQTIKIVGREFDANIDYYTTVWSSSDYNANLANLTAALSAAVYSETDIAEAYATLGFENFNVYDYDGVFDPYSCGYALDFKKSEYNNDTICLVTVRGSDNTSDWIGNFSMDIIADGKHLGFAFPAYRISKQIESLIQERNITGNIKYVITGHSRGAAVANLLAVKLMENGVNSSDVYNYNFACPDVACKYSFTSYSNIYNLCNREDPVPFVPGNLVSLISPPGMSWGKFGQTYWFTKDAEDTVSPFADHSIWLYLEFFDKRLNPDQWEISFSDKFDDATLWVHGWISKILCPVDVVITDTYGNRIASVISDEVNYYDSNFGDVIILTDGDKKVVFVSDDRNFNVELVGTDDGTMTYSVEKCNLMTDEIFESKTFENVKLENGKEMYSPVSNAETTEDIELFVIEDDDGEDVKTHTINTDGSETEIYHIYDTITIDPACTEKGYTLHKCKNCDDSYEDEYIDALGHTDDNHDGICDSCSEDFTKSCSCNCHSNAFMQFLHKILCFLYRIFGMEQHRYCDCGKAHW